MKPIKYLVPQEVENYIKKHELYNVEIRLTESEKEEMYAYVASKLSPKRYAHTRGVVEMALEYAKANGVDYDETFIAALFHDIAKEMSSVCRYVKNMVYHLMTLRRLIYI